MKVSIANNKRALRATSYRASDETIAAAIQAASAATRLSRQFTDNSTTITALAVSLFPAEMTDVGALNRLTAMFDAWREDTHSVFTQGQFDRDARLALKKQHNLGVFNYNVELEREVEHLNKRIDAYTKTNGLSECGVNLNDLIKKGHTRENLIKLYPPKSTLDDLISEKDRILAIQQRIVDEFNNIDEAPSKEFLDSLPFEYRNMRPTSWTAEQEVTAEG